MRNAILIQARFSSKRMPGKVMKKILNKEILLHVYDNCKKSKIDNIVILTSKNKSDDPIADLCKDKKIKYFRGSLKNVYLRYVLAIKKFKIKNFLRITADSPLIDYKIINKISKKFDEKKFDIVTNVFPRSYPIGQSVEMIKSSIFIKNYKNLTNNEKEHISSYFYKNFFKFKIFNLKNKIDLSKKNYSINTQSDFKKIRKIIEL